MKIIDNLLSDDQYYKETEVKKQIVLHHTAGGPIAANSIHGWQFTPERVGVAFVISANGDILKAFEPEYWAYHLAFSKITNKVPACYHSMPVETNRAKASIGIEVCNWGQLVKKSDGKYYNYLNQIVLENEVVVLKHRGFDYYHAYTDAQILALKELIIYLSDKFNISKKYIPTMWDINIDALDGEPGIYTHVSYRSDKVDMSPQPKLLEMLKSL